MSEVVSFLTGKDYWTIENVIEVINDVVSECEEIGDDLKSCSLSLTVFELKLLRDKIKEQQNDG